MSTGARWGLTRAGRAFCALGIGVGIAAAATGDPLLAALLFSQLATLTTAAVLSRRNLAGLRVLRTLPEELFAGQDVQGSLVVLNPTGRAAHQVVVSEQHTSAAAGFSVVPAAGQESRSIRWLFPDRGLQRLSGLRLRSEYPFGLLFQERELTLRAEVVVFPRPVGRPRVRVIGGLGSAQDGPTYGVGEGDFQGLREYVPGDPLRRVHWPTTARAGRPMVVVAGRQAARAVMIDVAEARGEAWERSLCAATAGVEEHFAARDAVGLTLAGEQLMPREDGDWRRALLERLALAERREA